MLATNHYLCVNCGQPSAALYKIYGPTVLKLTKCVKCKGIVDKYVEYDPVIVMIDLVLMSKEAQRHVLYNTEFKSYWKLLIILIMVETYGVWRSESLFNVASNTMCRINTNSTINTSYLNFPVNISIPPMWLNIFCEASSREEKGDEADLFIWEKDFYIKFTSIFAGVVVFILTVQSSMMLMGALSRNCVSLLRLVKGFALAHVSVLFSLPMLVWGAGADSDSTAETRALHMALVFMYSFAVFNNILTVLYDCPLVVTILILSVSNIAKYTTSFHLTPYLRSFVS